MAGTNGIEVAGFGALSNNWLQYGRGITGRLDSFIAAGNTAARGRFQSYLSLGANIGLLRHSRSLLDVSLYNSAGLALNHRGDSCAVLLTSAIIASRPMKVRERSFALYGGASRQTPLGKTMEPFFTPASAVYNGIAGVSVPLARNVVLFLEFNPGGVQRSAGVGVLYNLPATSGRSAPDRAVAASSRPEKGSGR